MLWQKMGYEVVSSTNPGCGAIKETATYNVHGCCISQSHDEGLIYVRHNKMRPSVLMLRGFFINPIYVAFVLHGLRVCTHSSLLFLWSFGTFARMLLPLLFGTMFLLLVSYLFVSFDHNHSFLSFHRGYFLDKHVKGVSYCLTVTIIMTAVRVSQKRSLSYDTTRKSREKCNYHREVVQKSHQKMHSLLFFEYSMEIYDLVCLSHLRWDFVYQRPQHLLSRCARERRVFFVEEPLFDAEQAQLEISHWSHGL